jgi:hypothetical protein
MLLCLFSFPPGDHLVDDSRRTAVPRAPRAVGVRVGAHAARAAAARRREAAGVRRADGGDRRDDHRRVRARSGMRCRGDEPVHDYRPTVANHSFPPRKKIEFQAILSIVSREIF